MNRNQLYVLKVMKCFPWSTSHYYLKTNNMIKGELKKSFNISGVCFVIVIISHWCTHYVFQITSIVSYLLKLLVIYIQGVLTSYFIYKWNNLYLIISTYLSLDCWDMLFFSDNCKCTWYLFSFFKKKIAEKHYF